MTDYAPTVEQGERAYCDGLAGTSRTRAESAAEYRRMIAAVERVAAQKGWDACRQEIYSRTDDDIQDQTLDSLNPYRREETE